MNSAIGYELEAVKDTEAHYTFLVARSNGVVRRLISVELADAV